MSESRKIVVSSLFVLLGQGLSRGLGVLLLPLLTLIFLPAQFGMSALATSYISFVSVVALLGLDLTYLQSIPGAAKHDAEKIEKHIWALAIVLAVCAAAIGSVAWWLWGKQSPESAPWLAVGIFSTMIFSVCQSRMKASRHYLKLALAMTTGGVVMYVWVLARGFSGHSQAITLVSGYSIGVFAAVLVSSPPIGYSKSLEFPGIAQAWQLIKIGLPAAFSAPIFWIISSMDRWLVAQFWGVSEAGVYAVAASISGIGLLFGAVVQTVWLTEASRLYNTTGGDCSAKLAGRIKEICFLFALAWLGLMAFSGEIVHLFAKPPYDHAIVYLPWLITSVMVYSMFQALTVYLIIAKQLNKASIIWLFGGMLFVALSLWASKNVNPTGIAKAQALVYGLMLVWVYFLVRRQARLTLRFGKSLCLMMAILVAGIAMVAANDVEFEMTHFIVRASCFTMLCLLVAWHFKPQLVAIFTGKKSLG